MSGDFAGKICAQQRIEVELGEMEMDLGGKVLAQMDVTCDVGSGQFHVGVAFEVEIGSVSYRCGVKIAGRLSAEEKTGNRQVGIDGRTGNRS